MVDFVGMIFYLEAIGIADVVLPFFLVFTIAFAILQKTHILGKGRGVKRFNVIVAIVLGMAVVFPHILGTYPPGMDIVNIINRALPQVSIVIIAIIMLLLMIGAFGYKWNLKGNEAGSVVIVISILIILYIFGNSAGWLGGYPPWLWFLADPQTQSLIVTILVFGIVVWLITRDEKTPEEKEKSRGAWRKYIGELEPRDGDE